MSEVFICLGGNIGKREVYLHVARNLISKEIGTITKHSSIYETEAWGIDSDKKYLNQVIKVKTLLSARYVIKKCLEIELRLGRKRGKERYEDRTIDIDILFYNREKIVSKQLIVPHPKIAERKFVLLPMLEIESNFIHPSYNKTIADIYLDCMDDSEIAKTNLAKDNVKYNYICVEGNIGSGKSTLAIELSKRITAYYLPELFLENDLLPLFYKNPKKYTFLLEYSFLISRYNQLSKTLKQSRKCVVADYSFYKCLWFAKINLTKVDYLLFEKHFHALLETLPAPDVIIKLNTQTKNLIKNIESRGRGFENTVTENYLNKINKSYTQGFRKLTNTLVIELNIEDYNQELLTKELEEVDYFIKNK